MMMIHGHRYIRFPSSGQNLQKGGPKRIRNVCVGNIMSVRQD